MGPEKYSSPVLLSQSLKQNTHTTGFLLKLKADVGKQ